jgi:hypothetical protein
MIHEKQVRQFCAIHCVNNLLQLSEDSDCVENEGVSLSGGQRKNIIKEWSCHGRLLFRQQWLRGSDLHTTRSDVNNTSRSAERMNWSVVATQSEFDDIADEITNRELRLMEGNEPMTPGSNDCTLVEKQSARTLSFTQRVRSRHGTPIWGNYSYEVLETALSRRGVTIEYYRVEADTSEITSDTIGFIVHEEETSADSQSYLRRLGSRVPIIKNLCKGGRHWWAVTGVKRSCFLSDNVNGFHVKEQKDYGKEWFLIDSNLNHILTLSSDNDLMDSLTDLQSRGALIFCCSPSPTLKK